MQGFFHLFPVTRRDAFEWIGIGVFFLIYMAAVTVRKVRLHGLTSVELVAIGMGVVCGLLFLVMGTATIMKMAK
jgi:hypothetical protein